MTISKSGLIVLSILLLMALWTSTEASVTVINSAFVPVDVETNGDHVTVKAGSSPVTIDVKGGKEQTVQVSLGDGKQPISVHVKDGDVVIIIPDILGGGVVNINVNGVFKGHL